MNSDSRLNDYARLVIEKGANVQQGEPVWINAQVNAAPFVRLLAQYAYERGASDVVVNWRDDALSRLRFEKAPMETLETVPQWLYDRSEYYLQKGACLISVLSDDPELLSGIDPTRIQRASMAHNQKFQPLQHYTMNDENSWSIVAIPSPVWAQKVFPDIEDPDEAVEKLWALILDVTRMNEPDPMKAWADHIDTLTARAQKLNDLKLTALHYRSSNGTDLTVKLPKGHIWLSATSENRNGTTFLPNIPTEEIFTMPDRAGVDGTLVATMPLAYNGNLIQDFILHFENGAVTSFDAKKGGETLKGIFEEDPNAVRLGEVALVPYDSPIQNSKTLFYETLFDENASCHFAFGACYPTTMEGGTAMSPEELMERGGNDSQIHVDFMVGAPDLSIVGTTPDGEEIDVFRDGNFAL